MKTILSLLVSALSLLAFASTAQSQGAEANGDFDFGLSGATGTVVFDAGINNAGQVNGQMTFSATVDVPDPNPDNVGGTVPLSVTIGLQFDCMVASGNRAAMSGVITSANVPEYIGQQALLVVEDEVPGSSPTRDAFAWGVYQPTVVNVNAKDYDFCPDFTPPSPEECGEGGCPPAPGCTVDSGASMTWTATDYELCPAPPSTETENFPAPPCPDPNAFTTGIPTTVSVVVDDKALSLVDCGSFPLSSYPLNLIPQGGGNRVVVRIGT